MKKILSIMFALLAFSFCSLYANALALVPATGDRPVNPILFVVLGVAVILVIISVIPVIKKNNKK